MMPYFNQKKFNDYLKEECTGKQLCYPDFDISEFQNLPENLRHENIIVYAQIGCSQTENTLGQKGLWGLAIVFIGIIMVLFFRFKMRFIYITDVCNEKIFDSKLITANDFTVKIKVTDEMMQKFEQEKTPRETDVKVNLYKEDLTDHLE